MYSGDVYDDAHKLGVELGQPRLAGIVEDEHGVDHGGVVVTTSERSLHDRRGTWVVLAGALYQHSKLLHSASTSTTSTIDPLDTILSNMRPATRFSGALARQAVRTPLRAQSRANGVIARASVASFPGASKAATVRSFHSSMSARSIMPDAENPAPKESESHDEPGKVTELSTEEFHERADYYLNELVERLEEAQEKDPQIEVEYSVSEEISSHA